MSEWWFPDLSTVTNFERADELTVLETILAGRGRATQAIDHQLRDAAAAGNRKALASFRGRAVLGKPISLVEPSDIQAIQNLRVDELGGDPNDPTELLGEAETVFLLRGNAEFAASFWVTDSLPTHDFGTRSGLRPLCTADLCVLAARAEILKLDHAFDLIERITSAGGQLAKTYASVVDLQLAIFEWDVSSSRPVVS
jgi:hypothetical protein